MNCSDNSERKPEFSFLMISLETLFNNLDKTIPNINPTEAQSIATTGKSARKSKTDWEPSQAPAEPKALIMPKYFLLSSDWKLLTVLAQKTETTKKLNTLYQM